MNENVNNKKMKGSTKISDKDKNNSNLPNQYAKVKNAVKAEEESKMIRIILMVLLINTLKKPSILPSFMNLHRRLIMIIGFQNIIHLPVSVWIIICIINV